MAYTAGSIENRYVQLLPKREPYLQRGREAALYTIPHLCPPAGSTGTTNLPTPYQSVGSDGVNNLAAKLLLSQLPPNSPFFRLVVDDNLIAAQTEADPTYPQQLEATLSSIEQTMQKHINASGDRSVIFEGLKQILVVGNCLFFFPYKEDARVFRLSNYVIARSPGGQVTDIVTKECVAYSVLSDKIQAMIASELGSDKDNTTVDVYSRCRLVKDRWIVSQEVCGYRVPDADGQYPKDQCPYIALRFTSIDGEDYGRGYVEEYLGDLHAFDGESRAILEGSIASARIIPMVSPNGTLRLTDLNKPNGTPVIGEANDLHFAQIGKQADLSVASSHALVLERRLGQAFLLMSGIQRDAERVTAEEIRAVIEQLDTKMGGFYSILAQEFQLKYVRIKMSQMQKQGLLPRMPDGIVEPTIVTGLEALGRGQDLTKLKEYLVMMSQVLGPAFAQYVNAEAVSQRVAASLAYDARGIMKSAEEVQAQMQQQQALALASKSAGPAINQLGTLSKAYMKQQSQGDNRGQ